MAFSVMFIIIIGIVVLFDLTRIRGQNNEIIETLKRIDKKL